MEYVKNEKRIKDLENLLKGVVESEDKLKKNKKTKEDDNKLKLLKIKKKVFTKEKLYREKLERKNKSMIENANSLNEEGMLKHVGKIDKLNDEVKKLYKISQKMEASKKKSKSKGGEKSTPKLDAANKKQQKGMEKKKYVEGVGESKRLLFFDLDDTLTTDLPLIHNETALKNSKEGLVFLGVDGSKSIATSEKILAFSNFMDIALPN